MKCGAEINHVLVNHFEHEALQVAVVSNRDTQVAAIALKSLGETMQEVVKVVAMAAEKIECELVELEDLPRTPEEIKKDIKHEKNPMRLKQLNKELNESYKVYKRRRLSDE